MPQEIAFTFPLSAGLHARPAGLLQAAVCRFRAAATLVNERSAAAANAKSVLALAAADVRGGDACRLRFAGADAGAAAEAVGAFVRDVLPGVDDPQPTPAAAAVGPLPRSLAAAGLVRPIRGTPVSPGVGVGTVVVVGGWTVPAERLARPAETVELERAAFAEARRSLHEALAAQMTAAVDKQETEVLAAHLAIADDVALGDRVEADLAAGRSAVVAVSAAADHFAAVLDRSSSEYLRERSLDVRDVAGQLLQRLCGATADGTAAGASLDRPSVVVADSLTPGQFLGLDRNHLRGLVLAHGGTTSHTVILARSLGVPAVVGVDDATRRVRPGREATVDANLGLVVVDPPEPVRRHYRMEAAKQQAIEDRAAADRDRPGTTADGRALEVAANVASAEEVEAAVRQGGQGIGLFRTEMLFMHRPDAPSEDEQAAVYSRAAAAAGGRAVIIRLLDAGGDKPIPCLDLPREANPFLGYRAVRFYADRAGLMRSQLRAVLRATACGDVRVMVPMVCCVEEARGVRAMLADAAASLAAEGFSVGRLPPLGIMVEVPSVALVMDQLCDEVDFFSIGSNDLVQYLLAADRDNGRVAHLYGWSHPAVLRTLKMIVDGAHARGKWVGLCGELADVPAALPAIVGLGLDEVSVSGPRVGAVKRAISALRYEACRSALEAACGCRVRAEAEAAIAAVVGTLSDVPLLAVELVHLDVDVVTKAEAIKAVADVLAVAGRTADERGVEEAVWQREETEPTGLGHGMAVPHCVSACVGASSIVVARLRQPVDWGDDTSVDVLVLLATRGDGSDAAREHMRVFAKLSRLVMRDPFRDRLRAEPDRLGLVAFLQESLELPATA
jgi:phosphoenolpyruvate-protein phosphotransferase